MDHYGPTDSQATAPLLSAVSGYQELHADGHKEASRSLQSVIGYFDPTPPTLQQNAAYLRAFVVSRRGCIERRSAIYALARTAG
jgi:hypothetical protein